MFPRQGEAVNTRLVYNISTSNFSDDVCFALVEFSFNNSRSTYELACTKSGRLYCLTPFFVIAWISYFIGIPLIGNHPSLLTAVAYLVLALGCFL